MVVDVLRDGPAAGTLRPAQLARTDGGAAYVGGDVIVRVEGTPIPSQQALARHLLLHTHPGETVSMTVLRDGETVAVTVKLGRRPELSVDDRV